MHIFNKYMPILQYEYPTNMAAFTAPAAQLDTAQSEQQYFRTHCLHTFRWNTINCLPDYQLETNMSKSPADCLLFKRNATSSSKTLILTYQTACRYNWENHNLDQTMLHK